jgi:hypothetical protein
MKAITNLRNFVNLLVKFHSRVVKGVSIIDQLTGKRQIKM